MVGADTYETVTLGFEEVVNNIKNSRRGTLIIITGRVGCGKTTLALKLLREINGCDDVDTLLITHNNVERINEKRHKAYLQLDPTYQDHQPYHICLRILRFLEH